MKKGCFIQSFIVITILVAAIVYIIQFKLDDWIVKPGKKLILSEVAKNWENEDDYILESSEKDSLKTLMKYYTENIKTIEDVVNLDQEFFLNELNLAIEDSLISENELSKLTSLLKKGTL